MKKIALCSLVLCGMIYGNVSFAADEICYSINVGGRMEQGKCDDKALRDKCNPLNAPSNGGWCIDTPDDYDNYACAAMTCNEGYLLWLTNTRQDAGRVIKAENNRKVGVQGLCFKKSDLEAKCKNACSNCPGDTKECKLKEREVTVTYKPNGETSNIVKTSKAFIGEEACVCVDKAPVVEDEPSVETDCEVSVAFQITCPDGTTKWAKNRKYKVKKSDLASMKFDNCQEFTDALGNENQDGLDLSLTTLLANETESYNAITKFAQLVCKGHMTVVETPDVLAAKRTINSFIATAKSEKRDVWTSADGTFNTARLASDLTAGVVLGTVGGVVSGVVIKKKQVEKGFDALHCTVGGQTVADWGDEFMVGLVR